MPTDNRKNTVIFVVVALICAILVLYVFRGQVYDELNNLKLIPQPERFTELYFQNSSDLPSTTVAKQPIHFAFTIHNVEGTTTVYPYVVYFENPDGSQFVLAQNSVTLADNASTTIPITYTPNASNVTGEVVVNLPAQNNQQIDFLLPDNNL